MYEHLKHLRTYFKQRVSVYQLIVMNDNVTDAAVLIHIPLYVATGLSHPLHGIVCLLYARMYLPLVCRGATVAIKRMNSRQVDTILSDF